MNTTYSPHSSLHRVATFFAIIVSLHLATIAPARAAEKFTLTGAFQNPRYNHAATLLANGKVLVSGGRSTSSSDLAVRTKADLYDPATGKWIATGAMLTGRSQHTATLLPNGKVLAVGGSNPNGLEPKTPELYDPTTGLWSATGAVPSATGGNNHRTALLSDGRLLAIWVVSTAPRTKAVLYDPSSNTWTATGAMINTVFSPTLTLLQTGKVLAAGGSTPGSTGSTNAEIYDPATGTWTPTESMNTGRMSHASVLLPNGKVLAVGGASTTTSFLSSSELYDPDTGGWTPTASLPTTYTFSDAVTLPNGRILFAFPSSYRFYKALLYNPVTGVFSHTEAEAKIPRGGHTMTLLTNGKVLLAGGYTQDVDSIYGVPLNSAEIYEPTRSPATINVWVGSTDYAPLENGRRFNIDEDSQGNPILVGTVVVREITIGNSGTADLTFGPIRLDGPDAGEFTATVPPVNTLAPGQRTTFTVTFKAAAARYPMATIAAVHIDSNDGDKTPFSFTYNASVKRSGPEILIRKEWINFDKNPIILHDNVSVIRFGRATLKKSTAQSFDIFSVGTTPLRKLSIRIDGKDSKDFTVTALKKTTLAVDGNTQFKVTFKPFSKGTKTAAIHIKSNDADENPFDIKLTGAGTAP